MRKHVLDLLDPSGKGEAVEIQLPSGTITVTAGLVQPLTGRVVVHVLVDNADGWSTEVKPDNRMGDTELRVIKDA